METRAIQPLIRIVIADDQKLLAKLIQSYLTNFFNIRLVGSARNGNEVLDMVEESDVDLILMDIMMPEMGGIETAKEILRKYPDMKIIFLSGLSNRKIFQEAIKLGAAGFLTKNSTQEEIINAINTVISGEKYFDKEILNNFLENEEEPISLNGETTIEMLTLREKEILELIVEERSTHEIADKLCLSPRTIETHKRNIMSKLNVKTTVALVKYVYQHGLLE